MHPQIWWFIARASGLVAWGLAVLAILLGLALATRALGDNPRPAWLLDLHRFVGGLTLVLVGVHLGALVADSYATFTLADLFIPLASDWKPWPVAWGVIAWWLLVAVEVSSLVMKRLPRHVWRWIHYSSYAVGVLSTVHAFTAGTDAQNRALTWVSVGSLGAVGFFFVYRGLLPKRRATALAAAQAKARIAARRAARDEAEAEAPVQR